MAKKLKTKEDMMQEKCTSMTRRETNDFIINMTNWGFVFDNKVSIKTLRKSNNRKQNQEGKLDERTEKILIQNISEQAEEMCDTQEAWEKQKHWT